MSKSELLASLAQKLRQGEMAGDDAFKILFGSTKNSSPMTKQSLHEIEEIMEPDSPPPGPPQSSAQVIHQTASPQHMFVNESSTDSPYGQEAVTETESILDLENRSYYSSEYYSQYETPHTATKVNGPKLRTLNTAASRRHVKLRKQLEDDFQKKHTFKPDVGEAQIERKNASNFYDRTVNWKKQVEEELKKQHAKEEEVELVATPKISRALIEKRTNKLYQSAKTRMDRLQKLKDEYEEEEKKKLREKPIKHSTSYNKEVEAKYNKPRKPYKHPTPQEIDRDCTGKPVLIAKRPKEDALLKGYLKQDVYSRLYQNALQNDEELISSVEHDPFQPRIDPVLLSDTDWNGFLQRQELLKQRKANSVRRMRAKMEGDHRPKILEKSRNLAHTYRLNQQKKKQQAVFDAMINDEKQKTRTKKKISKDSINRLYTGGSTRKKRPQTTNFSHRPDLSATQKIKKRRKPRNFDHLSYHRQKQEKLEELRKIREKEKIDIELKECTFQPKIRDAPSFVKTVAQKLRETGNQRYYMQNDKPWK
ncbi:hypothetical protein PCE1_004741 [Barthelona sp. PCE]